MGDDELYRKFKWEGLDCTKNIHGKLFRARLPDGWLIAAQSETGAIGLTFYPDKDHQWNGETRHWQRTAEKARWMHHFGSTSALKESKIKKDLFEQRQLNEFNRLVGIYENYLNTITPSELCQDEALIRAFEESALLLQNLRTPVPTSINDSDLDQCIRYLSKQVAVLIGKKLGNFQEAQQLIEAQS